MCKERAGKESDLPSPIAPSFQFRSLSTVSKLVQAICGRGAVMHRPTPTPVCPPRWVGEEGAARKGCLLVLPS